MSEWLFLNIKLSSIFIHSSIFTLLVFYLGNYWFVDVELHKEIYFSFWNVVIKVLRRRLCDEIKLFDVIAYLQPL